MASFRYSAVNNSGAEVSGFVEASSRQAAMADLKGKGLWPHKLDQARKAKVKQEQGRELKNNDIILFTEELSELLNAGLPLEPALASMESREEDGPIKETSAKLRALVTDGIPFHQSLAKVSFKFDELYCNLMAAGEASGSLANMMTSHGRYMREQASLKSKMLLAIIYPAALTLACIGVALVFIFFLLPMISTLLASTPGQEIPRGLKAAIWLGDALKNQWPWLLGLVILVLIVLKILMTQEKYKKLWDLKKMGLPFIGQISRFGFYVQWLQTLASLLANGVPLVEALKMTNQTVRNRHCKEVLLEMTEMVKDGYSLTQSMKKSNLFPASMTDLVAIGEKTGQMSSAIGRASQYYDNKVQTLLSGLMSIVTIAVLLIMAVLVLVLCYTMLQAIYGTMGGMRK